MELLKKFENKYGVKYHLNDSMLISFPKSGRTWVRMMLAKMLNDMEIQFKTIPNYKSRPIVDYVMRT